MEMNVFYKRISQISEYKGFNSVNKFALEGLNYASSEKIYRLKKENASPSIEIIIDITNKFVEINPAWLLTGRGEMLLTGPQLEVKSNIYLKSEAIINEEKLKLLEKNEVLYQDIREILKEKIATLEKSLQECQFEKQKYIDKQKVAENNTNVPNL